MLIDVAMPDIKVSRAAAAILNKRPGLPYLYMTGYIGPTKLDPAEKRVLKKPFTLAELAEKLQEALFDKHLSEQPSNIIPITRSG